MADELKARLYRRAGGRKICVAEGVVEEADCTPQFLAAGGKLYRWDQEYEEGGYAVYFWYRDLPSFRERFLVS